MIDRQAIFTALCKRWKELDSSTTVSESEYFKGLNNIKREAERSSIPFGEIEEMIYPTQY